ncbi:putative acetyltransferase [Thermosporothrix hazakensis]|jgi:predicted acetyltransferase|uniref:Acetyltransferase n=2 Tax=Thermosporothrix TaxID=768650 RepID=A0A455SKW9_9CHLR|nr:GNAT family N-acetyltransferase [Thermosporothrix hazakensis]PZW29428.1 putative acetyltransferase [Thermosporothrix hazakensis]BBH85714.1 acetyltransferase [Thermosporothrix sp. COM3]GCE45857.1 acetyltransferase [Thermosporothrix hazakensis]
MQVELQRASADQKIVLRHLMELCQYDYSEFDGEDVNEHGLFDYTYLDHYWIEPGRYPFLIRVNGRLAGFVLVRRLDGQPTHSIAEFFVLRKYRKQGIGRMVACRIFDEFPGRWKVKQEAGNLPAQAFWRKVIAEYTDGRYHETQENAWGDVVQEFHSRSR